MEKPELYSVWKNFRDELWMVTGIADGSNHRVYAIIEPLEGHEVRVIDLANWSTHMVEVNLDEE